MKFFAVQLADLEAREFTSASESQIATWLFLHALCSKQTNGGMIEDARSIAPKFWSRHGIDVGSLNADSPLWSWQGPNLKLAFYDIQGQELYERKSKGGKRSAERRWKSGESGDGTPGKSLIGTPEKTLESSDDIPDPTRPDPSPPDLTKEDETPPAITPGAPEEAGSSDFALVREDVRGSGGRLPTEEQTRYTWDAWRMAGYQFRCTPEELQKSFEVASSQGFKDSHGQPIRNVRIWIESFIEGRRTKGSRPRKPREGAKSPQLRL